MRAVHGVGAVLIANVEEPPKAKNIEVAGGGFGEQGIDHELRDIHWVIVVRSRYAKGLSVMEKLASMAMNEVLSLSVGIIDVVGPLILLSDYSRLRAKQEKCRQSKEFKQVLIHTAESFPAEAVCAGNFCRTFVSFGRGTVGGCANAECGFQGREE
jgi:hypothetical protein